MVALAWPPPLLAVAADAGSSPSEATVPIHDFVQYKELVAEELKSYKDFIQLTVTVGVFLLSAVFTFLNWKTRADIKSEVERQLSSTVSRLVEEKSPEILKNIEKKFEDKVSAVETHLENRLKERTDFVNKWLTDISVAQAGSPRGQANPDPQSLDLEDITKGKKILWVDDHMQNNSQQIGVLEGLKANVSQTSSSEAALRILSAPNASFDLIISDMSRPGEGPLAGITFLDRVKASNIPVVIFCGGASLRRHGEEAVSRGAYAVTASNPALFKAVWSALQGKPPLGVVSG